MDERNPTSCMVEVDVLGACQRLLTGVVYAAGLFIAVVIFCTSAVVSQLRQNARLSDLRAERTTAVVVSAVTKGQLADDVRGYAQNAKANKEEAHTLVVNSRLGIPQAPSN